MTNQKNTNLWIEGLQGSGKSTLLQDRQELELRIIKEVVGEPVSILPSKKWTKDMLKFDTETV